MGNNYKPPFSMTEEITNLIIEIGELVGIVSYNDTLTMNPILRRENRIKTIQSSLAIEQNTLTLEQVSDVIEGKRVLAPPQDIHEVKNAYEAYEQVSHFDPYSINDLLDAHKIMMSGLVKDAGSFRSQGVGVYAGNQLIHAGTPPKYIHELMYSLFDWLQKSALHPLVKSCIFHYEFEFIHPFSDGNGRTGRLWHSLLLQKWKPFFAWLPIETLIKDRQQDYYTALNDSNSSGESTIFVTFMLHIIKDSLHELEESSRRANVGTNVGINVGTNALEPQEVLLELLRKAPHMTASQAAIHMGLSLRQVERLIASAKALGKLNRIGASKNGYWQVN